MNIKDFLSPDCVMVDVRVADKITLLRRLARRAAESIVAAADHIAAELLKRENLGSTGTGGGVAIPHARLPEVKRPFGMLIRLREAIDFDAIDGQPVDIVFALLLPARPEGEQLSALACVARKLRDAGALKDLRGAKDDKKMYSLMVQD